jgi:hypothetical protein
MQFKKRIINCSCCFNAKYSSKNMFVVVELFGIRSSDAASFYRFVNMCRICIIASAALSLYRQFRLDGVCGQQRPVCSVPRGG